MVYFKFKTLSLSSQTKFTRSSTYGFPWSSCTVCTVFNTGLTPLKFNSSPLKTWLEDCFPIGKVTFQGRAVKLQCGIFSPIHGNCATSTFYLGKDRGRSTEGFGWGEAFVGFLVATGVSTTSEKIPKCWGMIPTCWGKIPKCWSDTVQSVWGAEERGLVICRSGTFPFLNRPFQNNSFRMSPGINGGIVVVPCKITTVDGSEIRVTSWGW